MTTQAQRDALNQEAMRLGDYSAVPALLDDIYRLREALMRIECLPWAHSESPYAIIARKALEETA